MTITVPTLVLVLPVLIAVAAGWYFAMQWILDALVDERVKRRIGRRYIARCKRAGITPDLKWLSELLGIDASDLVA